MSICTFWNPVAQFSLCSKIKFCPVNGCVGTLHLHDWTSGSSSGKQPRIVHDINHVIFLVSAIYQCSEGPQHTLYSTDSQILEQLNSIWIPFNLLHRTGFTRSFVNSVINLVVEGLPLQAIECHIPSQREQHAKEVEMKFNSTFNDITMTGMLSKILNLIFKPIPGNDLIARCFMIRFQQDEHKYSAYMTNLKVSNSIRIDHTFKVASNIGYLRQDGKWITLYNSVLIRLAR